MKILRIYMIYTLCALASFFNLAAQDSVLVKEVTVSQEFNPTVSDAYKINTSPKADKPSSYTPAFKYSFFNAPLKTEYEIQTIAPTLFTPEEPQPVSKQNYIKGGFGNYTTIMGELFCNAFHSDKQDLNFFYHNRSSWGHVTLEDNTSVDARNIVNYGKIDFQRIYRKMILDTDVTFDRHGYMYYGYSTMLSDDNYYYGDGSGEVLPDTERQAISNLAFNANLGTFKRRASELQYNTNLGFRSTMNRNSFGEFQLDIGGDVEQELHDITVGGSLDMYLGFYSDSDPIARDYIGDNYSGVRLAPYGKLEKDNLDLKFGFDMSFYKMDSVQAFLIAPIVDFNFNIVPKYFTGYITASGNLNPNTYQSVTAENPYVANDIYRDATKTWLDLNGGIVGHPTKELAFKLGLGYKIVDNYLFYVNEFVTDNKYAVKDLEYYTNRFVAEYDDIKVLNFHGEVSYNTYERWSVSASADIFKYTLDQSTEAWNLPSFQISTFGHFDVSDKIKIKGEFNFLPKRVVKVSQENDLDYLPVVYDLSLRGEYQYTDNLSFFADINNMAASRYHMYNGYPAYRLNALAGAVYRF